MNVKVVPSKGRYKDEKIYKAITDYCMDPNKAKSGCITGRFFDSENYALEMEEVAKNYKKSFGIRIRHFILSFDPDNEKRIGLVDACYIMERVCDYFEIIGYQVLAAIHENKRHLHMHIIINPINLYTGKKYKGDKIDYYGFLDFLKMIVKNFRLKVCPVK